MEKILEKCVDLLVESDLIAIASHTHSFQISRTDVAQDDLIISK